MKIMDLLERAKRQLAEATGLKPVAVTRAARDDQGWHVGVELLELARIPPSTDVLAEYELLLAADGGMLGFARKRTRVRGETIDFEAAA